MGDYPYRVMNDLLGSEWLPASLRTRVMRAVGFDLDASSTIWAGASLRSKKISVAGNVFINVGFYHDGYDMLFIERNVRVGPYVRIITATHEIGPSDQRGPWDVVGKPVRLSRGSWIGTGATILPGVVVAPGSVIAASAVVFESTEPDGLYAGNPARRMRELEP